MDNKELMYRSTHRELYLELIENKLTVILVAPIQGIPFEDMEGMCRVVTHRNPEWYSKLCSLYPVTHAHGKKVRARKKPRTIIKRQNILRVLKTLENKGVSSSKYADHLTSVARDLIAEKRDLTISGCAGACSDKCEDGCEYLDRFGLI